MSSGVPQRPSGMDFVMRCLTPSSSPLPYAVSIQPGPSTLTRMCGAAAWASARLNEYTPPFAAQNTWAYSPFIPPASTWSHDMFRMTPPGGCARISSSAFHEASTVPRKSTASRRSSFSVQERRDAAPVRMSAPALFTHTSTRPNARRTASARASTSRLSAMSAWSGSARRPAARACSAVSSAPRRLPRKVSATSAPAAAYANAMARPIPLEAPVTAALGDVRDDAMVAAAAAAAPGLAFVKLGFAGVTGEAQAQRLARAVRRAVPAATRMVLVAYADWRRADSLAPARVVAVAAETGAAGLLLDTAWKDAPLFALESPHAVAAWVDAARAAGLFAALAGSLSGGDFATARAVGAELVGVRGAACIGGRKGRVSRARVAALQRLVCAAPAVPLGALP